MKWAMWVGLAVIAALLVRPSSLPAGPSGYVPASPTLFAALSSLDEVPALSTTGTGEFRAKIVRNSVIEYKLTYSGIEGGAVAVAHIHFGRAGVNGGIIAFLCGSEGGRPCPPNGGTVSGIIRPVDVIGPAGQGISDGEFSEVLRAILNDTVYVNVHTQDHRAGEVRGQVQRLPGN